jgi:hypothetical protein
MLLLGPPSMADFLLLLPSVANFYGLLTLSIQNQFYLNQTSFYVKLNSIVIRLHPEYFPPKQRETMVFVLDHENSSKFGTIAKFASSFLFVLFFSNALVHADINISPEKVILDGPESTQQILMVLKVIA